MKQYLPNQESIIEDTLNVFALAHTYYVSTLSKNKFSTFQYFKKEIEENIDRILIEKLLILAIKIRFLDDKIKILEQFGRENAGIGKYVEGNKENNKVTIRLALNKLIHHESISVKTEDRNIFVLHAKSKTQNQEVQIPAGMYPESLVLVETTGEFKQKKWQFILDLFTLLNEILRVFHIYESNKSLKKDAAKSRRAP
jgi:hypothetical protein